MPVKGEVKSGETQMEGGPWRHVCFAIFLFLNHVANVAKVPAQLITTLEAGTKFDDSHPLMGMNL